MAVVKALGLVLLFVAQICVGEVVEDGAIARPSLVEDAEESELIQRLLDASMDTRIVGGTPVSNGDPFRWFASIQYTKNKRRHYCGGSLIHPQFVLTAAHCLDDPISKYPRTVQVGGYSLGNGATGTNEGEVRNAVKFITHPNYYAITHDLGIIKLDNPITNIAPIDLNRNFNNNDEKVGQGVTVIGFGYTKEGSGIPSNILNKVTIPVQSTSTCKRQYSFASDDQICAGTDDGGKDSCSGDSGGPLFHYDAKSKTAVQVGVVNYGRGCARPKFYGVYSRVSRYIPWISSVLSSNGGKLGDGPNDTGSGGIPDPTPAPTEANKRRRRRRKRKSRGLREVPSLFQDDAQVISLEDINDHTVM